MPDPSVSDINSIVAPRVGTVPAAVSAGTRNGTGVDRRGFGSASLVVVTGAETGAPTGRTVTTKIQHSADNGAVDPWADYTPPGASSVAQVVATAASSVARGNVDLAGARRYVRAVETAAFTGGTTPTIGAGSVLVLGGAAFLPAT